MIYHGYIVTHLQENRVIQRIFSAENGGLTSWDVIKVLLMSRDPYNFKNTPALYQSLAVAAIIAIMILLSTRVHNTRPLKVADPVDQMHLDPRTARLSELIGAQVVPGKSVGRIRIGESGENLSAMLGKPQLGDAAMCKSWSRWEWGNPQYVVEVFESCDHQQDMKKTVQQIRFSGLPFETQEGISLKSTFAQIEEHFRGLTAAATYKDKSTGQEIIIMDQVQQGIAFVLDAQGKQPDPRGECHMIIIHTPGKKAIDTYLQPEWDLHPL
jgi:hypothetical protein